MGGFSRRDFLALLGGGVVGTVASPLPWKLLDDAAIWTQNWAWLPRLPRGPLSEKLSHCSLCPGSCGLRVRCVGKHPYGVAPVPGHPVSGALCAAGLTMHHLRYHPSRLRSALLRDGAGDLQTVANDEAVAKLAGWLTDAAGSGEGAFAILDNRPGRVESLLYQAFLGAMGGGVYLTVPAEDLGAPALSSMLDHPLGPLGVDLSGARTVLSFGAALLDGWSSPGRTLGLFADAPPARPELIQVETRPSHTALKADHWLRIKPGSEAALALGLAHVIVKEELYDRDAAGAAHDFNGHEDGEYRTLLRRFSPALAGGVTGLSPDEIRKTARRCAQNAPSVAIIGADAGGGPLDPAAQLAIWGLNLLMGSVGRAGGFVPRRPLPPPAGWSDTPIAPARKASDIPDGSIRLLLVDDTLPGPPLHPGALGRMLARDGRVVRLSPYEISPTLPTHMVLPAPAPMEMQVEVLTPFDASVASYGLATPFYERPAGTLSPCELIRELAERGGIASPRGSWPSKATHLMLARAHAIHATGRGHIFRGDRGESTLAAAFTGEALWEQLHDGACWTDDRAPASRPAQFHFLGTDAESKWRLLATGEAAGTSDYPLTLMPFAWSRGAAPGALPQLMSKLYRESELRPAAGDALINPATARELGLRDRAAATLETPSGSRRVRIRFDAAVAPDVVHLCAGPENGSLGDEPYDSEENALALSPMQTGGSWRATPARVREA